MMYLMTYLPMSEANDKEKPEKKAVHPIVWLSLGVILYVLLQAFVFPKVAFPT